jgi:hypothetical protein
LFAWAGMDLFAKASFAIPPCREKSTALRHLDESLFLDQSTFAFSSGEDYFLQARLGASLAALVHIPSSRVILQWSCPEYHVISSIVAGSIGNLPVFFVGIRSESHKRGAIVLLTSQGESRLLPWESEYSQVTALSWIAYQPNFDDAFSECAPHWSGGALLIGTVGCGVQLMQISRDITSLQVEVSSIQVRPSTAEGDQHYRYAAVSPESNSRTPAYFVDYQRDLVSITSLTYHPTLGLIVIGTSFGCIEIYSIANETLIYASPIPDTWNAVVASLFLELPDDEGKFVVMVVRSCRNRGWDKLVVSNLLFVYAQVGDASSLKLLRITEEFERACPSVSDAELTYLDPDDVEVEFISMHCLGLLGKNTDLTRMEKSMDLLEERCDSSQAGRCAIAWRTRFLNDDDAVRTHLEIFDLALHTRTAQGWRAIALPPAMSQAACSLSVFSSGLSPAILPYYCTTAFPEFDEDIGFDWAFSVRVVAVNPRQISLTTHGSVPQTLLSALIQEGPVLLRSEYLLDKLCQHGLVRLVDDDLDEESRLMAVLFGLWWRNGCGSALIHCIGARDMEGTYYLENPLLMRQWIQNALSSCVELLETSVKDMISMGEYLDVSSQNKRVYAAEIAMLSLIGVNEALSHREGGNDVIELTHVMEKHVLCCRYLRWGLAAFRGNAGDFASEAFRSTLQPTIQADWEGTHSRNLPCLIHVLCDSLNGNASSYPGRSFWQFCWDMCTFDVAVSFTRRHAPTWIQAAMCYYLLQSRQSEAVWDSLVRTFSIPPAVSHFARLMFLCDSSADLAALESVPINMLQSHPWPAPLMPALLQSLNAQQAYAIAASFALAVDIRLDQEGMEQIVESLLRCGQMQELLSLCQNFPQLFSLVLHWSHRCESWAGLIQATLTASEEEALMLYLQQEIAFSQDMQCVHAMIAFLGARGRILEVLQWYKTAQTSGWLQGKDMRQVSAICRLYEKSLPACLPALWEAIDSFQSDGPSDCALFARHETENTLQGMTPRVGAPPSAVKSQLPPAITPGRTPRPTATPRTSITLLSTASLPTQSLSSSGQMATPLQGDGWLASPAQGSWLFATTATTTSSSQGDQQGATPTRSVLAGEVSSPALPLRGVRSPLQRQSAQAARSRSRLSSAVQSVNAVDLTAAGETEDVSVASSVSSPPPMERMATPPISPPRRVNTFGMGEEDMTSISPEIILPAPTVPFTMTAPVAEKDTNPNPSKEPKAAKAAQEVAAETTGNVAAAAVEVKGMGRRRQPLASLASPPAATRTVFAGRRTRRQTQPQPPAVEEGVREEAPAAAAEEIPSTTPRTRARSRSREGRETGKKSVTSRKSPRRLSLLASPPPVNVTVGRQLRSGRTLLPAEKLP